MLNFGIKYINFLQKLKSMKTLNIALFLILTLKLSAQKSEIKVFPQDNQQFTREKIINGLVSNGVKILNIKTNFEPESHVMGFFNDPVRQMGIGQGMILSTGVVDNITRENSEDNYTSMELDSTQFSVKLIEDVKIEDTSNNDTITSTYDQVNVSDFLNKTVKSGDSDLSTEIKGLKTFDARVIEIKFIPSADIIYYRYVFASEEYEEFVCSMYNDIFALYLYEKGGKKKNVAIIPNQNLPVSINTINNGNPANPLCKKTNPYLFQKNNGNQNLLYDGFTKVLDIREKVIPGKEYYLKIAIADATDGYWDSAVLLENGSIFSYFESFEIQFDKNSATPNETKKLEQILKKLNKYSKSKIQLIGHSDQPGSVEYNFDLSIKRVTEIKNLLISHGISPDRIVETYKGETMPRYKKDQKNRRVEIFIMGE